MAGQGWATSCVHVGRDSSVPPNRLFRKAQRLSPRGPVGPNRFQSRWCSARVVSTVLTEALRLTYWATTRTAADQMIQSMRDLRVEPAARELDHAARALVGSVAAVP